VLNQVQSRHTVDSAMFDGKTNVQVIKNYYLQGFVHKTIVNFQQDFFQMITAAGCFHQTD